MTVIENWKCSFFLHINFPMVLNDQKLWYFIKKDISKIMTLRDPKCILIIHCSFVMSVYYIYILKYCGKTTKQNNFTWYLTFHAGGSTIFSQVQRSSKNLHCNSILNITSFLQGSISQFLKFKYIVSCFASSSSHNIITLLWWPLFNE